MLALYSSPDQDESKVTTIQDCLAAGQYINAYCNTSTLMRHVQSYIYYSFDIISDMPLHRVDKVETGNWLPYDANDWTDVTTPELKQGYLDGMRYVYSDRYVRITGEWGYGTWGVVPDPIPEGTVAMHLNDYYVYRRNDEWLTLADNDVAQISLGDALVEWVPPADLNSAAQKMARHNYIMRTTDGDEKQGAGKTWMMGMDKSILTRFVRD